MVSPGPSSRTAELQQECRGVWQIMLAVDASAGVPEGALEAGLRGAENADLLSGGNREASETDQQNIGGAKNLKGGSLLERRPDAVIPQALQPQRSIPGNGFAGAFSPVQGLVLPASSTPPMPAYLLPTSSLQSGLSPPQPFGPQAALPPFLAPSPPSGKPEPADPSWGFKPWGEQMLSRRQGAGDPNAAAPPHSGLGRLEKWEVPIFKPAAFPPSLIPAPPSSRATPPWTFRENPSPPSTSFNSTPRGVSVSGSSTPSTSSAPLSQEFARTTLAPGALPPGAWEGNSGRGGSVGGTPTGRRAALDAGESSDNQMHVPQSVLKIVARALQADLTIAAILQRPTRLAETVLCVPEGLVTVPVRLSKGVLDAATGEVVDTEKLLLPSMLTAALGARPQKLLALQFAATGCEGLCYAMWVRADSVPGNAASIMADTVQALPAFLTSRVQAMSTERLSRRFDAILKRMPQGVVFIDDGLGPCLVNPAAAELLNLPTFGELDPVKVAATMHELAARSDMRAEVYRWFNAVAGNPNEIIESDWVLKNPRQVLRVRSYPVGGASNQLMSLGIESLVPEKQRMTHGRVWLFDDVTAERDARDAIEAADRAKSQFLAMMSHELRTPLTGVLGMLDLLRLTPLSSEQGRYVRAMQGSAESLLTIINDILDFSKIEAGHLTLEQIDFHLGVLVEQVAALFQGKLEEKTLKLTLDLPPWEELPVSGDPVRLRQVFANLVSNAIKFTEVGGISVSIQRVGNAKGSRGVKRDRAGVSRSGTPSPTGSHLCTPRTSLSRRPPPSDIPDRVPTPPSTSHAALPQREQSTSTDCSGKSLRRTPPPPECETLLGGDRAGDGGSDISQRAKLPRAHVLGRRISGLTIEKLEDSTSETTSNPDGQDGPTGRSDGRDGFVTPEEERAASGSGPPRLEGSAAGHARSVLREKSRLSRMSQPETDRRSFSDPGARKAPGPSCSELGRAANGGPGVASEAGGEVVGESAALAKTDEPEAGVSAPEGTEGSSEGFLERGSGLRPVDKARDPGAAREDLVVPGGTGPRRNAASWGDPGISRRASATTLQDHEKRVWLEIRVTDTGIGLTKEQQAKLFSAFIQADATTTRRFGGTGLGLAICKRLVNAMGGEIWITSEVGVGSTFAFTVGLRMAKDAEAVLALEGQARGGRPSTPPLEKVTKASRGCRVLVAEDNPINQMLIRKMLTHYGHEPQIVGNGQLAVDEIRAKPFHYTLILMDLQMPVLDGLGATKAIRALGPPGALPIFALTADVLVGAGEAIEEHQLDGYLTKPINWEKLAGVIEAASEAGPVAVEPAS